MDLATRVIKKNRVLEAVQAGESQTVVAIRTGVPLHTVSKWAQRAGYGGVRAPIGKNSDPTPKATAVLEWLMWKWHRDAYIQATWREGHRRLFEC